MRSCDVVVFAGQGDARRSMNLLWRIPAEEAGRPGPKPGLSVDVIVDAAIAIADEQGMAALSMRAVGERLGRTGMALYTYVPSKTELVDLMHDKVLAELPGDYDLDGGWRAAATALATDLWEFHLRHPWVLQVSQARPVLGPHEYVMIETVLRVLRATGLPARALRRVTGALFHLVRDSARMAAETRAAAAETGVPEEEWWYARSALLIEVAPDFADRFPTVAWMSEQGAYEEHDDSRSYMESEAWETFRAGLTLLFDGIEAAVRRAG